MKLARMASVGGGLLLLVSAGILVGARLGYEDGFGDGMRAVDSQRDAIFECHILKWNETFADYFVIWHYQPGTPDSQIPDYYDFNQTWVDENGDGVGELNPYSEWCVRRGIVG